MKKLLALIPFLFIGIVHVESDTLYIKAESLSPEILHDIMTGEGEDCCLFAQTGHRILVKAVICAGQSNMDGGIAEGTMISPTEANKCFIWTKTLDDSTTASGKLQTLVWGINHSWRSTSSTFSGPNVSFANSWASEHSDPIVIFQYAIGGSPLVDVGTAAAGNWQIDANPAHGPTNYQILKNNFVIPGINYLRTRGVYVDIVAFLWCQGEADANGGTGYLTYESELKRLINQLRIDIGHYNTGRGANIMPVITRIHNNFSPARPFQNQIRTALVNVATYYNMSWINSDSYTIGSDFIHWDRSTTGQGQHGTDEYAIVKTIH